jgi:hypothetical protein
MADTFTPDEQAHDALRSLTNDYVDAVRARLGEVPDARAREYAARLLMDELLPDAVKRVKVVRGEAVSELKEGRTLKQVAELTGLSVPRVDQLLKGK